uniref:Uncharacterized protein n=1 Tax=Meloidogyne enterolobii TaxID=390850 RepID=A0A6V7UYI4_MELEN|nr:unnamed protein product [Meloidogyne enterolobii]
MPQANLMELNKEENADHYAMSREEKGPKTLTCQTSWSFTRSVIFYGTNSASIPFRNVYVWWSKQVWSSHLEPVRVIKCRKLREVLRENDHRRGTKSMGVFN